MKTQTKHKLITAIVAVLMFSIAVPFTDGVIDSWKDSFAILYPASIVWIFLREAGFFRFKK